MECNLTPTQIPLWQRVLLKGTIETRVRHLENMQSAFGHTLTGLQHAVTPVPSEPQKQAVASPYTSKAIDDLQTLQRLQNQQIERLTSERIRQDLALVDLQQSLRQIAGELYAQRKHRETIAEVQETLKAIRAQQIAREEDARRLQDTLSSLKKGLGKGLAHLQVACSPSDARTGEALLQLTAGRLKRSAIQTLEAPSKRACVRKSEGSV